MKYHTLALPILRNKCNFHCTMSTDRDHCSLVSHRKLPSSSLSKSYRHSSGNYLLLTNRRTDRRLASHKLHGLSLHSLSWKDMMRFLSAYSDYLLVIAKAWHPLVKQNY